MPDRPPRADVAIEAARWHSGLGGPRAIVDAELARSRNAYQEDA